jgi:hypothetical protein
MIRMFVKNGQFHNYSTHTGGEELESERLI